MKTPRVLSPVVLISLQSALAIIGLSTYIGCSQPSLHVWSDHSDVALLVEAYNTAHDDTLVLFHSSDNPDLLLYNSDAVMDIIVTEDLHHETYAQYLSSVQAILPNASLYPSLQSVYGNWAVPLAFNLPLILATGNDLRSPFRILDSELYTAKSEAPEEERVRFFSLLWSAEFSTQALLIQGVRFFEGKNNTIQWNTNVLQEAAEFLRNWSHSIAPNQTQDRFIERTFTVPPTRLIQLNRIDRHWSTAKEFFSQHPLDHPGVYPRWLQGETGIRITGSIAAGIPKSSKQKQKALDFIQWISRESTHSLYLEQKRQWGSRTFGFIGGFSSLYTINEAEIQKEIGDLRMPLPSEIHFSTPRVRDWQRYKKQVLEPWILSYLRSDGNIDGNESLMAATQKWINQVMR